MGIFSGLSQQGQAAEYFKNTETITAHLFRRVQGESYEIYYGIIYSPKLLYPFLHNTCIRGKCHLDDTYFFAEQAPEQSKKRRRYLGYMLVSFLFFLPYFGGEFTSHFTVSLSSQYLHL